MPELPEVQTIVSDLNKKVRGLTITDVWTDWPKYFRRSKGGFNGFRDEVRGKKINQIRRIGKNIVFDLSDDQEMLVHQKMTGHMLIGKWGLKGGKWVPSEKGPLNDRVNGYIHTMFWLSKKPSSAKATEGTMMALSDLRKFAKIIAAGKKNFDNLEDIKNIGPDPLMPNFTVKQFISLIRKKRGPIKRILMDQNVISGVGNIYSDDILFMARIHPLKRVEKLSDKELKTLFEATKKILKKAVKLRGTSTSDYRDAAGREGGYTEKRLVYQREGEPCPKPCKGKIVRLKIGGRSAHFCPICQKL